MRSPEIVLNNLASKSNNPLYHYERLYRNLYNKEFYMLAYQNLLSKHAYRKIPIDRKRDFEERIDRVIRKLKDQTYRLQPVSKQNGVLEDQLVLEIIRMLLVAIYEGTFSDHSHSFRSKRSCHTALTEVQSTFTNVKWFILGGIQGCFEQMDQHLLIHLLRRKVKDEKFIQLIYQCLKAGYLYEWKYHQTYSGTPLGGVLSSILANIYFHQLDTFVSELKHSYETMDVHKNPNDKQLFYTRYADDYLIGVIGSKKDAETVKDKLIHFCHEKLKLSLKDVQIVHAKKAVHFLGYQLKCTREEGQTRKIKLYVPKEKWIGKLRSLNVLKVDSNNQWKAIHRTDLVNLEDTRILQVYNQEIKGIYRYYQLANNVTVLRHFYYIMQQSLAKTLACKYNTSVRKIMGKYRRDGLFTVTDSSIKGRSSILYHGGFKRRKKVITDSMVDVFPVRNLNPQQKK
ncbi:reverse transcriptase/maturase family protein [Thermoflavimicrobium daqui]|uniref:Group II intron reverse transcriptase/maturase n=1 Tax=Thermoflavimicrobium daqui TaxID=2137476 RepID=A0A364K2J6_9BACL|nr:reverse transcriptase/maturase family protein [Thermoflavimicrobium daqui]RAL22529.1 group II intron reverse transcriptase/maturase [Thermoflavimicrobium daqui]